MKLKKYNQYIKEELAPMSAEAENDMTGEVEGEIVGQDDDIMGDDASTPPVNDMNDQEEGEEEEYEYEGTKLMKELADKLGVKVENNSINFDGKKESNLTATEKISFGVEYLPKYTSTKYFNQVFYRAGFQQVKTPYLVNGTHIKDNSFSLGLSTPLAYRSVSYIDFSVSVGNRGVIGNGLVKENYIKISLGFSLMDTRWFLKPKID
jgi:hypothetical protein